MRGDCLRRSRRMDQPERQHAHTDVRVRRAVHDRPDRSFVGRPRRLLLHVRADVDEPGHDERLDRLQLHGRVRRSQRHRERQPSARSAEDRDRRDRVPPRPRHPARRLRKSWRHAPGSFGGLSSPDAAAATVRTTTAVAEGRAGLAYAGLRPPRLLGSTVYLCGLRQNAIDRSNVAVLNAGPAFDGDITLRLTVVSGDPTHPTDQALPDVTLSPGGFNQVSGSSASNGLALTNGYVHGRARFGNRSLLRLRRHQRPGELRRLLRRARPRGPGDRRPEAHAPRRRRDVALLDGARLHELHPAPEDAESSPTRLPPFLRAPSPSTSRSSPSSSRSCPTSCRSCATAAIVSGSPGPTFAGPSSSRTAARRATCAASRSGRAPRTPEAAGGTASSTRPCRADPQRRRRRGSTASSRTPRTARTSPSPNDGLDERPVRHVPHRPLRRRDGSEGRRSPDVTVPANGFTQINRSFATYAPGVASGYA